MQVLRAERLFGGRPLSIETGKIAKQAHGAVVVQYGDTVVLVAAVEGEADPSRDFFPLTVDYREKTYAAGKFPGGFIKREGRPTTKEILTARMTDRPLRPLFPANYMNEVQVMAMTLSADRENDPDVLAMIGASAALSISHIPFQGPTGSIRIARIGKEFIPLPTHTQLEESDLDMVVAGHRKGVAMIEGFARELPDEEILRAIMQGQQWCLTIVEMIEELRQKKGLGPVEAKPVVENPLVAEFYKKYATEFRNRKVGPVKAERGARVRELRDQVYAEYLPEDKEAKYEPGQVSGAFEALQERVIREMILEGVRLDGRTPKQIRPIWCEAGLLPRTHGSAIFQRGETQALVTTVLGTGDDEQRVDGIQDEYSKKFMLDYNFPPFSVGECRRISGPGRREIGHGALAERSLKAVIPPPDQFPYTIRVISDIMESNGSSSMASVCGATLSMMDAGVPIADPVAGISIGLVKTADRFVLLTDIMGDEDHFGDMDFKVAGTQRGITGIQLDLKIDSIDEQIIRAALEQAKEARRDILKSMLIALRAPRPEISKNAPRLLQVKINPEKIGLLIGPGGKTIRALEESTGAKISIEDDGTVTIASHDSEAAERARAKVEGIADEIKVGKIYDGKVQSIKEFGAFIELVPGKDGLCHISELDDKFVGKVEDVVKVGDHLQVKVIAIDAQDRVKLSRKAVLREQAAAKAGQNPAPAPQG